MAAMATIMGLGQLFYILLGFRHWPFNGVPFSGFFSGLGEGRASGFVEKRLP